MDDRAAGAWAVVLAGGEGLRLRSVTRAIVGDDRPKQYVPLTDPHRVFLALVGQRPRGTLRRRGRHPRAIAKATVFDLKKLEDFSGNYAAAGAGATVGGGGEAMIMRNQNGVVIELTASLKAATSGLRVSVVP